MGKARQLPFNLEYLLDAELEHEMTIQNSQTPSQQHVEQSNTNIESASQEEFSSQEKFELLSAYLDDEVTSNERRLVDFWLASDADFQSQYRKQLKLREALKKWL